MKTRTFNPIEHIHGLRLAAKRLEREEFHKILYGTPEPPKIFRPAPVQLKFNFERRV